MELFDVGVLALLVVGVVVFLDQLAVLDHAPPRAGLELLHLDERLEAVQVGAGGTLDVAHPARRLLDQRAGVDVDAELDPRQARRELVEGHDAGVRDSLRHAPLDALVRTLGLDLGLELLRLAPDLRREIDVQSSSWVTRVTRCMNSGQSSNCVHWL